MLDKILKNVGKTTYNFYQSTSNSISRASKFFVSIPIQL